MKIILAILDIITVIAILFVIVGAAFIGWSASASKRANFIDKAEFYYATEICGESEVKYWAGEFIDDVTALFD